MKAFAEKLVNDHTAAGQELDALVKAKHADWPADMISDHESTIARFARYALNAKDAQIKAFAQKLEPELRAHLKMARDLRAKVIR